MEYMFPFRLVPKGSKVVLYGAGDIGKDFYLQMRELGDYYQLVAWVAGSFDPFELRKPFDYVRNIPSYDFDYIVIAVKKEDTADEIRGILGDMGIAREKMIWSRACYMLGSQAFPKSRERMLTDLDFYMDIMDDRVETNASFGRRRFYDSFLELGIDGVRSTEERMALYRIRDFLTKDDTVLDIGCNCGFLALQTAPYVKYIQGVDVVPGYIRIANKVKDFLQIPNAEFDCRDIFRDGQDGKKYDAVFALAMHRWAMGNDISADAFAERVYTLLETGGYLFFESHGVRLGREDSYSELCDIFTGMGMEVIMEKTYCDNLERIIRVFRK